MQGSKKQALVYALIGVVISVLFWILGHRIAGITVLSVNLLILSSAFCLPAIHSKIQEGFSMLGYWMGVFLGVIFLSLLYWTVFVPGRIILAIMGKDPLQRHIEPDAKSYWEERKRINTRPHYYRLQY